MEDLYKEIVKLRITETKYKLLVNYIKMEAKEIYFDKNKILNLIDILEDTGKSKDLQRSKDE